MRSDQLHQTASGLEMATMPLAVTYLVSGDEDIKPATVVLRRTRRKIRHDSEVHEDASNEIRAGGAFVVVAHGASDGTVSWYSSVRGNSSRWLWVGMPRPPKHSRLYLYSCRAGGRLVPFLRDCVTLGHVGVVPMPIDEYKPVVLGFLRKVDGLIVNPELSAADWKSELAKYVNRALDKEARRPDSQFSVVATLLLLRMSLGNADA